MPTDSKYKSVCYTDCIEFTVRESTRVTQHKHESIRVDLSVSVRGERRRIKEVKKEVKENK